MKTHGFSMGADINEFSTDGTLAGDSDNTVPTEKAVATAINTKSDNILINQDFTCWQDSDDYTNPASGVYTSDGYRVLKADGTETAPSVNVKKNTSVHEDAFEQSYELEITNVGVAGLGRVWGYQQVIADCKKYRGRTVTFSVRIKASTAITFPGGLYIVDSVGSDSIEITSLGTDWETYTVTRILNSSLNTLRTEFFILALSSGKISWTGSIYIQWMKFEIGSVATPLILHSNAEEYLLCGTTIAPQNRTNPSFRFEDDAGNLGIEILDGGEVVIPSKPKDNIFINQDFSIWQEQVTFTNPDTSTYSADMYKLNKSAGGGTSPTVNVKKNTTVHETEFEQTMELEITNVGAADAGRYWLKSQYVENFKKYAGKNLTASIRLRASTTINLSNTAFLLYDGTNWYSTSISSIGTDWTTISATGVIDDSVSTISCSFRLLDNQAGGNGTISTTGSIYIQWMKLEIGSVATPLIPRSTGEELALCQRYYQKSYIPGTFPGASTYVGAEYFRLTTTDNSDHALHLTTRLPVVMKSIPSVTIYDAVGNVGKVTMEAGDNIDGTVGNSANTSFRVNGTNGVLDTIKKLVYHWIAVARV